MNRYQKGFGVVEIIIIIVVLALAGVGGWYVWQANNKPASNQQAASTNKALEIPEYGIKVNDPDGRILQTKAEKTCGAQCDTENTYLIRDSNDAYFARCDYPVGISPIEERFTQNRTFTKKIGNTYFYVSPGSNYQSPCMNLEAGDEQYEDALRQYVLDNMVAL